MKVFKKSLSVLLSVLMVISCISVSFSPIMAQAATPTNAQLKSAFQAITNTTDLTNGDGSLLSAAEVLYQYIMGNYKAQTNSLGGSYNAHTLTTIKNNSIVDLNSTVKSAVGSTYNTLVNTLLPTSGVYDDSSFNGSGKKTGSYTVYLKEDFDTSKLSYVVTSAANKSVTVGANLEKTLLSYKSLSDVPSTILLSVTYSINHAVKNGYKTSVSYTKRFGVVTKSNWSWSTSSWHYISGAPSRSVKKSDTAAYKNLHAFADYFTASRLATPVKTLASMSASEINAVINANNTAYAKLNSYSDAVKTHFFDMAAVKTYMDNCLFAQKVINAKPAITALNNAMTAGYDANNLEQMNSIYSAQKPNLDFLTSVDSSVITYVAENFDGYDTFSLSAAQAFMAQLNKDIELYKLREIKGKIDALRAQFPDADSISAIDKDENGNYINNNLNLWTYYDIMAGYINTVKSFEPANVAAVFTDGTAYAETLRDEFKFEYDYRDAEGQYESYYAWFLPLIYDDLTAYTTEQIIGSGIAAKIPNIPNALSKKTAYTNMYNKYTGLIGKDSMEEIFGKGEDSLGYIIDDYIARLYDVILARLTSEVNTAVGYYDAYGEVNLSNYVAIKEAIGRVENNIWDFINSKNPSIISSSLRNDYNRLSTLLSKYNAFIASDGLNNFERKHLHDANGVYINREPTEADQARITGENYTVNEKVVNATIKKLDAFLISNDFTKLVDIDKDPDKTILLDDYLKEVVAENLYTNDMVNMLMNIIYPELAKALEDLYRNLPSSVSVNVVGSISLSYNDLPTIINKLGVGVYPNQVAPYIASGYGTAKSQLAAASTWSQLQKDGDLVLDWGVDSIKPENYSSTDAYLTAKKNKFLGAMAESLDAVLPLVRVIFGDWADMNLYAEEVGKASKWGISLKGDLTLTATGIAGYSDIIVPILEALGCSGIKSYSTVKGYTTSRQFVDAIFLPIVDFVENKFAKAPVSTLCSILPNLSYAISFDKLWDLFTGKTIRLNYLVEDSILGVNVLDDFYDFDLGSLISKDSLDLDFDISSVSSIMTYLLSMFTEGLTAQTLPIMNTGELITYSSLNKNASTLRHTGSRINFTADKADIFMWLLNYLVSCLGNEDFLKFLENDLLDGEMDDTVKDIIQNIYAEPDLAIAAVIELLNQQGYGLDSYNWYDGSVGGTVEGITPAALVYLSGTNNWNKETADYVEANINEIVSSILTASGSDIDLTNEITTAVNGVFKNATVTSLAGSLASISDMSEKLLDMIKNELGVDLTAFSVYADLPDDYSWGFEDGDRDGFVNALITVLKPLEPLYGFLLAGENLTLFKDVNNADLVTFYGNEGYDNAVIPLLEALGCKTMTKNEFKSVNKSDMLKTILDSVFDRLDEIAADPIYGILDVLPGLFYYITSGAVSTSIRNLLHPLYVILDTIRPVYNVDVDSLLNSIDIISEYDITFDIDKIDLEWVVGVLEKVTGLNLNRLQVIIEDICSVIATDYASTSSFVGTGKKGAYTEGVFDRADMITVIVSYLLEMLSYDGNAAKFDEMIGTENFTGALLAFFNGVDPETKPINWMYYFGEDADLSGYDFSTGVNIEPTLNSLTYPNYWTKETAAYINDNLSEIVTEIVKAADEKYSNLSDLLKDQVVIYSTENVQAIADALKELLKDVDKTLLDTAGVVFGADFTALENYTAPQGIATADEFTAALEDVLSTVSGIVNWLLFGKDYRFFTGTSVDENGNYIYNDLITIKGGEGYKKGLAPILEALGCKNIPTGDEDNALSLALTSLFARVDEIFDDPENEILAVLPNVIYFLNADGLTTCLYNVLSAAYTLVESINGMGADLDVNELLGEELSDLSFEAVIKLAEKETELDLAPVAEIFGGLCVGTIKQYESVSGEYAYKMSYTGDADRKDMITLLITTVLRVIKIDGNEKKLRELLGEDVYTAVLNVLNLKEFEMQEFSYLYTEYADTDKVFSAMETSELYAGHKYGPLYTQDKAQYIADHIDNFIDNMIYLLGIEINGTNVDSLKDLLNSAVNGSLYNSENAQKLLEAVQKAVAKVDELKGSEHIKALIRTSLGVNLDAWDNFTVPEFENDRTKFTETVCDILAPLDPVLKWALCNKDFSFFVDDEGKNIVTLLGGEGYAYGVIPILEVLGCDNILTKEEYYAAADNDSKAMLTNILNPLFDRLDEIMAKPADEILEMLPAVIYFINSNGLDTCFKNALHAVYGLLNAIEPLVEVDLYSLINVRLDEITFDSLFDYALDLIAEKTGYEFSAMDGNAIIELTVGKLVSYTSKNGEKAYTMVYQSEKAKAEMVTIVERLLITFIMKEDNREKFIGLLRDELNMSPDAEKYVRVLLDCIAECTVNTYLGMDKALAEVYYVFYGVDIGADKTAGAVKNINKKWQEIIKKLGASNDSNEASLGNALAILLDGTLGGIFDSNGLASGGFIKFFERLREIFMKIIEFFRNISK